jgi:histone-arginine methyltransferase CARM1
MDAKMGLAQPAMITVESHDDMDGRDPTYFSYYAQFVHQQNMLQDSVRTSLYQNAILSNAQSLFSGKTVMDLGGNYNITIQQARVFCHILRLRLAQISYVTPLIVKYIDAVEASGMADRIQKLMDNTGTTNQWLKGKVVVVKGKIEDIKNLALVDTLISEPIGVLLVHERMVFYQLIIL